MLTELLLSILQKYQFEHMEIDYNKIILEGERTKDYFILDTISIDETEYIIMMPVAKLEQPYSFDRDDLGGIQIAIDPDSESENAGKLIDDEEEFYYVLECYGKYLRSKRLN